MRYAVYTYHPEYWTELNGVYVIGQVTFDLEIEEDFVWRESLALPEPMLNEFRAKTWHPFNT